MATLHKIPTAPQSLEELAEQALDVVFDGYSDHEVYEFYVTIKAAVRDYLSGKLPEYEQRVNQTKAYLEQFN